MCSFHEVGSDILKLLQRFESLYVHDAVRKQSSILTINIIPIAVKCRYFFSLLTKVNTEVETVLGLPNAL